MMMNLLMILKMMKIQMMIKMMQKLMMILTMMKKNNNKIYPLNLKNRNQLNSPKNHSNRITITSQIIRINPTSKTINHKINKISNKIKTNLTNIKETTNIKIMVENPIKTLVVNPTMVVNLIKVVNPIMVVNLIRVVNQTKVANPLIREENHSIKVVKNIDCS